MIVFNQVTRSFDPEEYGVFDVSFFIESGDAVIITGPSGAGKTTLMRLLTKEYIPDSGEIIFQDQPLSEISNKQLHQHRRNIGVIYQNYRLLPELNVWENIALPLSIVGENNTDTEQRVSDLLNLVGIPDKALLFPNQLSGGEAQRVSIARSLALGPKMIFADEPTGNLDADTSLEIARLLNKINQLGTTLLFATHDPIIIEEFKDKRRINLKQGRVETDTDPKKMPKGYSYQKEKLAPAKVAKESNNETAKDETEIAEKNDLKEEKPVEKTESKSEKATVVKEESIENSNQVSTKRSFIHKLNPFSRKANKTQPTDLADKSSELTDDPSNTLDSEVASTKGTGKKKAKSKKTVKKT